MDHTERLDRVKKMNLGYLEQLRCSSAILAKAKELGASLTGFCDIEDLKTAPSYTLAPRLPQADVGSRESDLGLEPGEVYWPEGTRSALVIAYVHPEDEPHLDWWHGKKDPPGNRILVDINKKLSAWIEANYPVTTHPIPYHIEKGGHFLKDAAYYAGLGSIGKNNLVITPEYGPRVRLRAMLLSESFPATGPAKFNPCALCPAPCLEACPQKAFKEIVFSAEKMEQTNLPGLIGNYSRDRCNSQMTRDSDSAKEQNVPGVSTEPQKIVKYCRNCEFSCPVGK